MDTTNNKVSVVMCTYNGAKFVIPQLESILGQTYTDLEVIIADDASTDDTFERLQPYAALNHNILLFRNEANVGYNTNFSEACRRATGACIAISDQDDVWELDKIEKLLTALQKEPETLLVHGISARFENDEKPHLSSLKFIHYFRGNDVREFFLQNIVSGHNMLFKRELLEHSLPFPSEVYYDWWLTANACCHGRIDAVEEILVWHRMHEQNATGKAKPKLCFYKQVQIILPRLLSIAGMKTGHRVFGQKLLDLYQVFPEKKFSFTLFRFLFRHASILLAYKKRKLPWISYFKHSMRYAKRDTIA